MRELDDPGLPHVLKEVFLPSPAVLVVSIEPVLVDVEVAPVDVANTFDVLLVQTFVVVSHVVLRASQFPRLVEGVVPRQSLPILVKLRLESNVSCHILAVHKAFAELLLGNASFAPLLQLLLLDEALLDVGGTDVAFAVDAVVAVSELLSTHLLLDRKVYLLSNR